MKYKNRFSPTQIIALGFLITIVIGSLLFMLPISRTRNFSYLDALFTATSATCVTGHSTIDAFQDLTTFGQVVLMLLIQIGGLRIYFGVCTVFTDVWQKNHLKESNFN